MASCGDRRGGDVLYFADEVLPSVRAAARPSFRFRRGNTRNRYIGRHDKNVGFRRPLCGQRGSHGNERERYVAREARKKRAENGQERDGKVIVARVKRYRVSHGERNTTVAIVVVIVRFFFFFTRSPYTYPNYFDIDQSSLSLSLLNLIIRERPDRLALALFRIASRNSE